MNAIVCLIPSADDEPKLPALKDAPDRCPKCGGGCLESTLGLAVGGYADTLACMDCGTSVAMDLWLDGAPESDPTPSPPGSATPCGPGGEDSPRGAP